MQGVRFIHVRGVSSSLHVDLPCSGDVECQGMYSRNYVALHEDRYGGCTSITKLWEGRNQNSTYCTDDEDIQTVCDCCQTYIEWKKKHPNLAKSLQKNSRPT